MSINKLICGASTTNQMIETVNACVDGSKALDGIKALEAIEGVTLNVTGFYAGSTVGGGQFIYDAARGKADHNGGTVIAPEAIAAWDGTSGDIATLLDWTGSGSGCFVRLYSGLVDFEWFGAIVDGADSTLQCDKATSSIVGGSFTFRVGLLNVDYLKFDSNQSLICSGFGCKVFTNASATLPTIHTRNPSTSVRITLKNFTLNGNKANQTLPIDGINLDATGMVSSALPRHHLSQIFIENTKGRGLVHPFPGRDSNYSDIVIYNCDEEGFELFGSDSQFSNINVGQSGFSGVKVSGGSANLLSNVKSWYSGRITPSLGHGFWLARASGTQMSNCESQENQTDGLFVDGTVEVVKGVSVTGFVSNSDNTSGLLGNGIRLLGVEKAIIEARVWAVPELAGAPSDALSVGGGTNGCKIKLVASDFTSYAIDGDANDIGSNEIQLNDRENAILVETNVSGFKVFSQFSAKTFDFTLSGNVTIKAPTSRVYSGTELIFILRQGLTGGNSISFDPEFKTNYTADTSAGAINVFQFKADKAGNWLQIGFNSVS